jgi:isopentenyl-diphosphate delta-isomerase
MLLMKIIMFNIRKQGKKIHSTGLWHRGIHILIFNSDGKLLLPFRSPNKDKFPHTYDTSVSEHCKIGESYNEAARRGMKEELKIANPKLKLLGIFKIDCGTTDKMISAVYECIYDGKIEMNKKEIISIELKSVRELKEMLKNEPEKFAPWTKEILKWYLHQLSSIRQIQ